jgi:uridine kinase
MALLNPPLIIGIAGGSGSGKTTVASAILQRVGKERITVIPHDAYYRDLTHLSLEERSKVNFDHPDSLETEFLIQHLKDLKEWKEIDLPVYDFTHHTRTEKVILTRPQRVIVIEGILIFAEPELRKMFDIKIFVDTDADIRFIRRMSRDIEERGRTVQSVIQQYLNTVRPMHLEFCEPSKRYADVIIPEGGLNIVAMDMVIARIQEMLKG